MRDTWTACTDCVYFEDCTEKEARDGCYFGDVVDDHPVRIRIRKDRPVDWTPREYPLHTGDHSQ